MRKELSEASHFVAGQNPMFKVLCPAIGLTLLTGCTVFALSGSAMAAEPNDHPVKHLLQSETYNVEWGTAANFDPAGELEIGHGNGHGFTLNWIRFRPGKDGIEVLLMGLDEGRQPYDSKWPPDRVPVTAKLARLKLETYFELLRAQAIVDSAKLRPVEMRNRSTWSSNDFWVSARLATEKKTLLDLDWAGYQSSSAEIEFAKPLAAVGLARETIKELDFQAHPLTVADRAWASAKFSRDWKRFQGKDSYWWVRERYLQMIGVVGDETALPLLREVLATEPANDKPRNHSDGRCIYYAINAVTRLTKRDVRDEPIEEMDIEKTRLKVLELIKKRCD